MSTVTTQIYHEDDKEGLRNFLRQPSAQEGKTNGEQLGLTRSDMDNWQNSEEWIAKLENFFWNNEYPKRLVEICSTIIENDLTQKGLAGALDTSKWSELIRFQDHGFSTRSNIPGNDKSALDVRANRKLDFLDCSYLHLGALDLSANAKLRYLFCSYNQLTALDISTNTELEMLSCENNQLTTLDISVNTKLEILWCHDNCLSLSDLFAASEMITKRSNKRLGVQGSALTVSVGSELYAEQSVFKGIYTTYRVLKYYGSIPYESSGMPADYRPAKSDYLLFCDGGGVIVKYRPAPKSDYTVIDGKITFHSAGEYQVTMKNKAIVSHRNYPADVEVNIEVVEM